MKFSSAAYGYLVLNSLFYPNKSSIFTKILDQDDANLQAILNSTKEIEKLILDYTQSNNTKIKEHAINIQNKINTI